jgi:hypothetical protein
VLWSINFLASSLAGKRRALIPPDVGYTDPSLEPQPKEVILPTPRIKSSGRTVFL